MSTLPWLVQSQAAYPPVPSLRELESKLRAEERYMVVEESPFPDFVLEDAGM